MSQPIDDPYEVLGLPRHASPEEIRKRYKSLAVQHHPDRNPDPQAIETFKRVAAAYAILNDPIARERWVRDEANTAYGVPPSNIEEPLQERPMRGAARAVSAEERRRRQQFARSLAEEILESRRVYGRRSQDSVVDIQEAIAGVFLVIYLLGSVELNGLPFPVPEGLPIGFIQFCFWGGTIAGMLLVWQPEASREAFATLIPISTMKALGWSLLLGVPLVTWLAVLIAT